MMPHLTRVPIKKKSSCLLVFWKLMDIFVLFLIWYVTFNES
jgi:hypothetical protein